MNRYEIEVYQNQEGYSPFQEWLDTLKDKTAQIKVYARLERIRYGNFGDWKSIKGTSGLYEIREHYGQGYRIFYSLIGKKVVLLLAGGEKKEQEKTIAKAKDYLTDYKQRRNNI